MQRRDITGRKTFVLPALPSGGKSSVTVQSLGTRSAVLLTAPAQLTLLDATPKLFFRTQGLFLLLFLFLGGLWVGFLVCFCVCEIFFSLFSF